MKVLFTDINAKYINPTSSLIPALLKTGHEVVFFGPGFVSAEKIRLGVERFCDEHGPFDFLITTRHCWQFDEHQAEFYKKNTAGITDVSDFSAFFADMAAFIRKAEFPVVIFLTSLDVYAISRQTIEDLENKNYYLVTWANGFSAPLADLKVFEQEEFFQRKKNTHEFGLWHDFVDRNSDHFINLGHFVGPNEFHWKPLEGRKNKVIVPGQAYHRRKEVVQRLKKEGFSVATTSYNRWFAILNRLGFSPYANFIGNSVYNLLFQQAIFNSRFAYTEGYGYERPIRKFFEIPALGAVLLATPCIGWKELGFRDRENMLAVSTQEVGDAIHWLDRSPEVAQEIADEGRDHVWRRHSLRARATQFTACLEAIKNGNYSGSYWQDGGFFITHKGQ